MRGSREWKETARTPAGALRARSAGTLSREHRPSVLTLLIEEETRELKLIPLKTSLSGRDAREFGI